MGETFRPALRLMNPDLRQTKDLYRMAAIAGALPQRRDKRQEPQREMETKRNNKSTKEEEAFTLYVRNAMDLI